MSERSEYEILVIEDTPEFARLTLLTLERFGFRAVHAEHGEAAINYMETHRPNVVLLDLNLPDLSGWQILDRMKTLYGDTIPVIIVTTAYSDSANRVVGKLQAVHRYMVKPFSPQDLVKVLDEILGIPQA